MRQFIQYVLNAILIICSCGIVNAQSFGDYKAVASGNFEDQTIWQVYDIDKNWKPAEHQPDQSSFITIAGGYSVTLNADFTSTNKLLINGTFTIVSGVTFTAGGTADISYATVNGPGTFSVASGASLQMTNTTIAATGNLTIQSGGTLTLSGNSSAINGTCTSYGTTTSSNSIIGSGTFTNNGTFDSNNGSSYSLIFVNNGAINYTGTYGVFEKLSNLYPGTVNVSANSTMKLSAKSSPLTESGIFNISSGGVLSVENGYAVSATYYFNGTIAGAGTFRTSCTTNNISGTYNITGTTRISGGTVNFDASTNVTSIGTILTDAGTLNLPSGFSLNGLGNLVTIGYNSTINFNTGNSISINSLTVNGGTIAGSDSIIITNNFDSQGSVLNGPGTVIIAAGCTMSISTNPVHVYGSFVNNGTFNWTSQSFGGSGTMTNNGIINISAGIKSCGINFINSETGVINSSGEVKISGSNFNCSISNLGVINVNGSIFSLAPYNLTSTIAGTINCSSGATLALGGTGILIVNSDITCAGTVSMSGNINLHGKYNNTGTTAITGGTVNFNSDMTLTNLGNLNSTGGTVNFKSGLTINGIGTSLVIKGNVDISTGADYAFHDLTIDGYGSLSGSDNITISGSLVSNGYLRGPGNRTILDGGTGTLWGNGWIQSTTLYNYGTLTWQDSDIKSDGTIDNKNVFNITSNTTSTSYVTILNNGTINRITNSTSITFNSPLVNNGTLNINAGIVSLKSNSTNLGTININSGSVLALIENNFAPAGIINISSGGSLTGNYQLNFNGTQLNNDGTISAATLQFGAASTLSGAGVITSNAIVSNTGHVTLGSDLQLSTVTINSGGAFDISSYTLRLNKGGLPLTNNGTFSISNGTVEYNGSSAQTSASLNVVYQNLTVNNSAGVSLSSAVNVNGTLKLLLGAFTNGSFLTMGNGATIFRSNGTISSAPNFGSAVNLFYSEIDAAITSGLEVPSSSSVLNNLTVNNSGGLILSGNITANGTVTLQNGNITTGSDNILTLASSTSLAGEANGRYVIGKLIINKNVNTSSSDFGGIGVSINSGTDNLGNVTVTRISGSAGKITSGSISSINRTWIIASDNPPSSGRSLSLSWVSDDDNGKNLTQLQPWQSKDGGTNWITVGTMQDASSNRLVSFNTTSFGEFTVSDPSVNVNLKVFLQGPYNGSGAMTTTLNSSGLIPLTSETAYPSSTYGYTASTIASIPNSNIVDWILVELRSGTAASTKVAARAGFLKNDGTIVDVDGTSPLSFGGIFSGIYYIVVRHRNHLAIMSSAAISLSSSTPLYDFSTAQTKAYGTNPMAVLADGKYGMWAGDADGSATIDSGDRNNAWNSRNTTNYYSSDINLDGVIDSADRNSIWNNRNNSTQFP